MVTRRDRLARRRASSGPCCRTMGAGWRLAGGATGATTALSMAGVGSSYGPSFLLIVRFVPFSGLVLGDLRWNGPVFSFDSRARWFLLRWAEGAFSSG